MRFEDFKEGTRCWKGYKKKGMKTMFGKRVPNCVKNEADSLIACKDGEYYCNDSKKCKPIPPGHYVDDTGYLVKEDLRAWFGKGKKGGAGGGGWDRYNSKGERIGKCGDSKPGEGKPKCLSKSKAASLRSSGGKKAIANAVKRKRRKDPNPDRRGKAKNVKNKVKDSIEEYGVGIVTKQNATKDVPVGGEYMNVKKLSLDKKPKKKTKKLKANYNRNELPQIKNKQLENIKHTLETIKVKDLIPVQEERIVENFKKQVDNIVAGDYNPIIIDRKNRIVNGHHRYTALQMLGIKEANVARLPFTLEKILQVYEAHHFKNPKNTFLTKADTAYDFLRIGKHVANIKSVKKGANRDEPDVMVVPFGGDKEKKHLKKHLNRIGYKTQDADKKGDDGHVDETKEAPPGTYFTKSGNLVKGRLSKKAKQRGARETDPKDKTRSKVPPVTQSNENFADGKKKGKSRPGRVKRSGASCKGSVTDLRKRAKNSSGEKRSMYHWCANMKSGRSKK